MMYASLMLFDAEFESVRPEGAAHQIGEAIVCVLVEAAGYLIAFDGELPDRIFLAAAVTKGFEFPPASEFPGFRFIYRRQREEQRLSRIFLSATRSTPEFNIIRHFDGKDRNQPR